MFLLLPAGHSSKNIQGVTLTSQVVRSAGVNDERRGGAHGRRLLFVHRQHGKVLLGHKANGVPLAVVQPRVCGQQEEKDEPSEGT